MTNRICFHLDENVDPVIAVALRRYGADVTTTIEAGLLGSDDETQLAFAKREDRVIVTHDDDFLRLVARDQDHPMSRPLIYAIFSQYCILLTQSPVPDSLCATFDWFSKIFKQIGPVAHSQQHQKNRSRKCMARLKAFVRIYSYEEIKSHVETTTTCHPSWHGRHAP